MQDNESELNYKRKELEKQNFLLQMKEEIDSLEKQLKYFKLINLKMDLIKNAKITARVCQRVAPYVVSAGIVAGAFKLFGIGMPFYPNNEKCYSNKMMEYDDLGNIRYEQQYDEFSHDYNSLSIYSNWQKHEDGWYKRTVTTYKIKVKTYEEVMNLINQDEVELENVLGECLSTICETKNNLTEEELNEEPHIKVIMYDKDKNDYIIRKQPIIENVMITIFYVLFTMGVELIPWNYRKKVSSFNYNECVQRIKTKYQHADFEKLKLKLEIRKNNYKRMMR